MNPRTWVETAKPAMLTELGDAWIGVAVELEGLFSEYQNAVTTVNGAHWEGQTAEAAQARAQADNRTMQLLADKLEAIGNRAKLGYDEVNAPLLRAQGALTEAKNRGYEIADTLALSLANATDDQAKQLQDLQTELNDAVRSAMQADIAVRDALNAARADLRAAFTSAAALGTQQARADGERLLDNPESLSPEVQQRLIEAGQLTPEQLAALQRGETATIPASQMEYLNALSRTLDGKSPAEIEQVMSKLPPETQKAMANSFQIMSNPQINAGPVANNDKELPNGGKGGLTSLPQKMQASLTRTDLVTKESKYLINEQVNLNGVADNKAIAKMIDMGDPEYKVGSDVDRKLLDVGSQYLAGIQDYKDDSHDTFGGTRLQVDGGSGTSYGIVEGFFAAAGEDKIAVQELVTGEKREELFNNITSHPWEDNGAAAATLFQFAPGDATIEDPNNLADVKAAERHGSIMSSVGEYLSGAGDPDKRWEQMTSFDSQGAHTFGEQNPLLAQAFTNGLTPHIETLAGGQSANTAGFNVGAVFNEETGNVSSWADPDGNGTFRGSTNILSVLSTDENSIPIIERAVEESKGRMITEYAQDPSAPGSASKLGMIGTLEGMSTGGKNAGVAAQTYGDYSDELSHHEGKKSLTELPRAVLSDTPFVGSYLDLAAEAAEEKLYGDPPEGNDPDVDASPNFNRINHEILGKMSISADQQVRYGELFNNGSILTWEEIQRSPNRHMLAAQSAELFDSMDHGESNSSVVEDFYRRITAGAPSPQKPEPEGK